jgi:glycosyltransferase involved in cell wall biosynthesis
MAVRLLVVRAFGAAQLGSVILLLAGEDPNEEAEVQAVIRGAGVEQRVRLSGAVDDNDLSALCAEALRFAYPSRYEGFGLQICEALSVGCPTLVARATALPEVDCE